ncbi:hypothetical protein D3C79_666740 [compost metagenome]
MAIGHLGGHLQIQPSEVLVHLHRVPHLLLFGFPVLAPNHSTFSTMTTAEYRLLPFDAGIHLGTTSNSDSGDLLDHAPFFEFLNNFPSLFSWL